MATTPASSFERSACKGLRAWAILLIGEDGERLAFFDEELVPWPCDSWAEQLPSAYPHITIDPQG